MPRIFDNIQQALLPALQDTLNVAERADFCVGYFNLRGWKQIDSYIEQWAGGDGQCCRLLVGMQKLPQATLKDSIGLGNQPGVIDNQTILRLKRKLAEEFREQLALGIPTNEDEAGLRRLARQIRAAKVVVKLFLRHPLHAKLYLLFRPDPISPSVGYLGSSNLTFAGLSNQGELNIDVLDHDACDKLAKWFDDRWSDRWCVDISDELATIIETSWVREEAVLPYHVYLKIAYHLSREARSGLNEFRIPRDFGNKLFEFQTAAVKIAAHHLNKRGGVLIGDVVGLGKSLMATALARVFQDDHGTETLIICPKNLVKMWEGYVHDYRMVAKIVPLSRVIHELPDLRRYRVVLVDESHNLRNREGKRFKSIQEYIAKNDSHCILLSATPYNKTYLDLSAQLRLFISEGKDLGLRPERLVAEIGETEFIRRHQCPVRSLAAFEKSEHADDWRDLMRLYMVRRTRSFIMENYADTDAQTGRRYLTFEDGSRSYFPIRTPRTVSFKIDDRDPADPYARFYSTGVVDAVNGLNLPRYGLGNYIASTPHQPPTQAEAKILDGLGRAGTRLMGFCRTNLFKRLESGGPAFIQSVERHILRNFVFLHALEHDLPLSLGTQGSELLDARTYDEDADADAALLFEEGDSDGNGPARPDSPTLRSLDDFRARAAQVYADYAGPFKSRFKWLRASLFIQDLGNDLQADAQALLQALTTCGEWNAQRDTKLNALADLLTRKHPRDKVLIFTQFADTARYVSTQLAARGIQSLGEVTGSNEDPTSLAWRFSPVSNGKRDRINAKDELRILVATDVLSEGQNLQDCAVIVNYDLPWAIIRLIQRVGRVDRIGQQSDTITCYSFLPADGVERIIRLRGRVRQRLQENAEVVGSDETFFEDDADDRQVLDLYHEKAGLLDGEADSEVDLASYAYQIWKNALTRDAALQKIIEELPDVVYSARAHVPSAAAPSGALVYLRTAEDNDALAWMDENGSAVTQSQFTILRAAACAPDTPAVPRGERHHELVQKAAQHIINEEKTTGGALGRPSGARFRSYERLKHYLRHIGAHRDLLVTDHFVKSIERSMDDIFHHPLYQSAIDALNRQMKAGIADDDLANLVIALREDDRLCIVQEDEQEHREPRIICSLGLNGT